MSRAFAPSLFALSLSACSAETLDLSEPGKRPPDCPTLPESPMELARDGFQIGDISPAGDRALILSLSDRGVGTVRVFDLATGEQVFDRGGTVKAAFTSSSNTLLIAMGDLGAPEALILARLTGPNGQEITQLTGTEAAACEAWMTADRRRLIYVDECLGAKTLHVISLDGSEAGTELYKDSGAITGSLRLSPDSRRLAYANPFGAVELELDRMEATIHATLDGPRVFGFVDGGNVVYEGDRQMITLGRGTMELAIGQGEPLTAFSVLDPANGLRAWNPGGVLAGVADSGVLLATPGANAAMTVKFYPIARPWDAFEVRAEVANVLPFAIERPVAAIDKEHELLFIGPGELLYRIDLTRADSQPQAVSPEEATMAVLSPDRTKYAFTSKRELYLGEAGKQAERTGRVGDEPHIFGFVPGGRAFLATAGDMLYWIDANTRASTTLDDVRGSASPLTDDRGCFVLYTAFDGDRFSTRITASP